MFGFEGYRTSFACTAEVFHVQMEREKPDIFIINLNVGDESGLSLLRRVKAVTPLKPVFMLSDSAAIPNAASALKMGAEEVFSKPLHLRKISQAVSVSLENAIFNPWTSRDFLIGLESHIPGLSRITPREKQILELVTRGFTNKEIGRALTISPRTAEVHRGKILAKLAARNTAQLVSIIMSAQGAATG